MWGSKSRFVKRSLSANNEPVAICRHVSSFAIESPECNRLNDVAVLSDSLGDFDEILRHCEMVSG